MGEGRLRAPLVYQEARLTKIYTLGYEGSSVTDFIATLKQADISLLLDIRQLPQSRRPGFSKRVLSEALNEAGIGYRHLRELGDPKPGRDAARRGDMAEFRAIFSAHLASDEAQAAIQEVAIVSQNDTIALMCYERAPKDCHRSIVAERIRDIISAEVVHLGVQSGRTTRRTTDGDET